MEMHRCMKQKARSFTPDAYCNGTEEFHDRDRFFGCVQLHSVMKYIPTGGALNEDLFSQDDVWYRNGTWDAENRRFVIHKDRIKRKLIDEAEAKQLSLCPHFSLKRVLHQVEALPEAIDLEDERYQVDNVEGYEIPVLRTKEEVAFVDQIREILAMPYAGITPDFPRGKYYTRPGKRDPREAVESTVFNPEGDLPAVSSGVAMGFSIKFVDLTCTFRGRDRRFSIRSILVHDLEDEAEWRPKVEEIAAQVAKEAPQVEAALPGEVETEVVEYPSLDEPIPAVLIVPPNAVGYADGANAGLLVTLNLRRCTVDQAHLVALDV